jgi:SnoaL-like domain
VSTTDIIKAFIHALEAGNFEAASGYLTDDFHCSGLSPQQLDKGQFIQVIQGLKEGIPNLTFHLQDVHAVRQKPGEGEILTGTMHMVGTQTDGFILPPLGLPPIPQMAKSISLPQEQVDFSMKENRIAMMRVHHVPGGGIKGILQQLDIDMPEIAQ